MHFGATLRLLRTDAGMSLRALARHVGVSSAYLSRVENGRDAPPTPERLTAIAAALELPANLLVELASQTAPALSDYIQRVPAAAAFFLEVARRDLDPAQVARLREVMDEEFPAVPTNGDDATSVSSLIGARMLLGVDCASIEEVVARGAGTFAARDVAAADVTRLICEREAVAPTVVGKGVAVPHAVIPGARAAIAMVTLATPLPPAETGASPVEVAFVLVSGAFGREHLENLAKIARLASHGVAAALRGVGTPGRATNVLRRLEASSPLR